MCFCLNIMIFFKTFTLTFYFYHNIQTQQYGYACMCSGIYQKPLHDRLNSKGDAAPCNIFIYTGAPVQMKMLHAFPQYKQFLSGTFCVLALNKCYKT